MNKDFIREANEYKVEDYGSIYDEVRIMGKKIEFSEQLYFDDTISVFLPKEFIELPDAIKKLKYPSENRPQVIRTAPEGGIDFALNLIDIDATEDIVEAFAEQMYTITKSMKPSEIFLEKKAEISKTTENKLCWFDYVCHGIDGKIYLLLCITRVDNKLMNIIFSCPENISSHWKNVAIEVFNSLKVVKNEE